MVRLLLCALLVTVPVAAQVAPATLDDGDPPQRPAVPAVLSVDARFEAAEPIEYLPFGDIETGEPGTPVATHYRSDEGGMIALVVGIAILCVGVFYVMDSDDA